MILEIIIISFIFLIFYGYLRNFLLNNVIDSTEIILTTALFAIWYSLSYYLTELII